MPKIQEGFFLIADITGYTQYLSQSELDHAQQILTVLLELLVDHTRPPLIISRLAGDAVISYGLKDQFLQGQTFIEMIEDTYISFRLAIEHMVHNNTCQCNACTNISSLDLKFFVHYGPFAIQHISDHDELAGSEVNQIHRLLKNHVTEKTGFRAYTLYTQKALEHLGIEGASSAMIAHSEEYEHLGAVNVWLQDMHPIWEQKKSFHSIVLPEKQVNLRLEVAIHLRIEQVWDYLIQPEFRRTLMNSLHNEVTHPKPGRIGPGSVYQCYHGDIIMPQTVVEWVPFSHIITQDLITVVPIPNVYMLAEYRLIPMPDGVHLRMTFMKSTGPLLGRKMCDRVLRNMKAQKINDLNAFKLRIEKEAQDRQGEEVDRVQISDEMVKAAAVSSLSMAEE